MLAAPSLAIDLSLKALVSEDNEGKVWVTDNSSEQRRRRHDVPAALIKNIADAGGLLEKAVE